MKAIISLFVIFVAFSNGHPTSKKSYSIQNRIAGGNPASEGQFPFQVGLRTYHVTENNETYSSWCGGSLITENAVLTAAHCLGGVSAEVILGAADLNNENKMVIEVGKEGMISHEEFHKNDHDIALIMLPHKVQLNDKIQLVNLPRRSQENMTFEHEIGWISGWGLLGDNKGSPEQLNYARRWILPNDYCDHYYKNYFRGDLQVCVDGSYKTSSCRGDSGGPLTIVEKDETRTLVGLASYGIIYCEKDYPTVYTRITPHLDWISRKTGIIIRD